MVALVYLEHVFPVAGGFCPRWVVT